LTHCQTLCLWKTFTKLFLKVYTQIMKCSCGKQITSDTDVCQDCLRIRLGLPLVKDLCKCGKELMGATICDDCDFRSFRNTYLRKQKKIEIANLRSINNQKQKRERKPMKMDARILIYDEVSGVVVGWKD
jgi:hypothetical protein